MQTPIENEKAKVARADQTRAQDREQALGEILDVINQSRDTEAPVFDAILRNARRLCGATTAGLLLGRPDEDHLTLAALSEAGSDLAAERHARTARVNSTPMKMDPDVHVSAQAICSGDVVHIADLTKTPGYIAGDRTFRIMVDEQQQRACLSVPLIDATGPLGAINLHKRDVGLFSNDDVALMRSFAVQAVIAIENVRQFREVQTRLEREKASADILEAISRNREDEQPVLDAIVQNAARLTHAKMAGISLVNPARTELRYAAVSGTHTDHFPKDYTFDLSGPLQVAVTVREARVIHTHDLADDPLYAAGDPVRQKIVDGVGIRTFLTVPLIKDGVAFGCLNLNRDTVRPFDPDEIQMIETFAAQAVIAIENVRQFLALQEQLDRETSSAEVLDIISRSREDDLPVFDKITQSVARLCDASLAYISVLNADRTHITIPAQSGARPEFAERLARFREPVENDWIMAVDAALNLRVIRIDDLSQDALYKAGNEYRVKMVDEEGMRSVLVVPLASGDTGLGCIFLYRREVRAFSDAEIDVVRAFAAQAVIAIENVRQFREVQDRLDRERASAEILGVISQSRDDEKPVFDVILRNAAQLCNATQADLDLVDPDGRHLREVATWGDGDRAIPSSDWVWPMDSAEFDLVAAIQETRIAHVPDLRDTDKYRSGNPMTRAAVDTEGMRTLLVVPLVLHNTGIGCIVLFRQEVHPFSDSEIALVETFAAQAVIAIENVRQFKALETLNAELGDRVTAQVGEIERMGKLKRFLPAAVADTVISSGTESLLKSHRALLGVLFCDIRGFTAFCETAEPEETIEVLQTYHEEMGKLINAHGAGVDHRMGDGIMVLFNDPLPCDDPAGDAVRLALAMRSRMAELCKTWKRMGHRLGFGVGISLGYATVGLVGYEGRSDYTASGTAVNVAARLCDYAEDGEILFSTRAAIAVEDDFASVSAGDVTLKGIREPVEIFKLASDTTG